MTTTIGGTTGITFPDATTQNTSPYTGGLAFRNRIINGAMQIDQRNAGASVTVLGSGYYTVDRFSLVSTQSSKMSVQQSTTAPIGFKNSIAITSLSAYSVGATDAFNIDQRIEGFNVADLAWGTASAQAVTVSFWVRSSLTGTFGGAILNGAGDRSYPFSYTISAANTFEYKTVTIPGDTSGTWLTTNGIGLRLSIGLGVGSTYSGTVNTWGSALYLAPTGATSVVGTSGATFYITGVQLEKGSTATSFDYRPYGTELALCQRYLPVIYGSATAAFGMGQAYVTTAALFYLPFQVAARVPPTGISTSGSFVPTTASLGSGGISSSLAFYSGTQNSVAVTLSGSSGLAAGSASMLFGSTATAIYGTGCEL